MEVLSTGKVLLHIDLQEYLSNSCDNKDSKPTPRQ